jgi:hypothetical protein
VFLGNRDGVCGEETVKQPGRQNGSFLFILYVATAKARVRATVSSVPGRERAQLSRKHKMGLEEKLTVFEA